MGYWSQSEKITVPNGGTATFTLKYSSPLERLTIWAVSGNRTLTNMTVQPQLNGVNFGGPTNIVGAVAADLVLSNGGSSRENVLFPTVPAAKVPGTLDGFTLTVLLSNAGASPESITMIASAIEHNGG